MKMCSLALDIAQAKSPADHNLRMANAKNFKFGMDVAPNNRSKKIMLNKQ